MVFLFLQKKLMSLRMVDLHEFYLNAFVQNFFTFDIHALRRFCERILKFDRSLHAKVSMRSSMILKNIF